MHSELGYFACSLISGLNDGATSLTGIHTHTDSGFKLSQKMVLGALRVIWLVPVADESQREWSFPSEAS